MVGPAPREPLPLATVVPAGTILVRQGDAGAHARVVVSGALLESCIGPDGRVLARDVLGPGDLIGSVGFAPSPVTVRALRLCRIRAPLPDELPLLLEARELRVHAALCDVAWLDVGTRVERRLRDLALRFGRPARSGTLIDLFLSQEEIGGLVAASRETVNRCLRRLAETGAVTSLGRGRYGILDGLLAVAR